MKRYLYISDTKLDMLAAQIPPKFRDKIVGELTLDVKLVKLTLREDRSDETRYSKLALVTEYLRRHTELGTVDEPASFFAGGFTMHWGVLGADWSPNPAIYFFGETERATVGLGGSLKHAIGAAGVEQAPLTLGPSEQAMLVDLLTSVPAPSELGIAMGEEAPPPPDDRNVAMGKYGVLMLQRAAAALPVSGPLEFMAERHQVWPVEGQPDRIVVLGSPIYVARAD